ncbi:hypothetical protein ACWATR_36935 [Nostoc sp. UIC 10890]
MKVITFVYNSVAKVSSSVSIGLLVSGIIAGTSACNRENITTVQHGSEELVSIPTVLKVQQIKAENPDASKPLPKSNSPHSSRTLPSYTQVQNVQPSLEPKENGKLRFVNDTPYMSIVYIYASTEKSYKYAYVPPCTTRELYDTYSNSQLISLNGHAKFPIAKKAKREDDFFAIKMSALVDYGEQEQLCEFNPSKAVDISLRSAVGGFLGDSLSWIFSKPNLLPEETFKIVREFLSSKIPVGIKQTSNISEQVSEQLANKIDFLYKSEKIPDTVEIIESYDKLQEAIWLRQLIQNDSIDEKSRYLLSSTRRKIELGEIENVDELTTHLNTLKEDPYCAGLYKIFLNSMINAAPELYQTFARGKKIKDDIKFSYGGQPKFKPLRVNNVLVAGTIQTQPQCASTINNNPVFTLISDYSRTRFQTVLQ